MIASHYGANVPLEFIRKSCGEQRGGVTFLHIRKAANLIGLDTAEIQIDSKNLREMVDLPCILHWSERHYVVLYHISNRNHKDYYHIADPAYGKIKLDEKDFLEKWYPAGQEYGYAMAFDIADEQKLQQKHQKEDHNQNYLWQQVLQFKTTIIATTFILFITGLLSYGTVRTNQWLIDLGIVKKDQALIIGIVAFLFVASISKVLSEVLHQYIIQKSANKLFIHNLRKFLKRLTIITPRFFEQHKISELVQKMDDHNKIEEFNTQTFPQLIFNLSMYIFYSIILYPINKYLFFWMLLYSILSAAWMSVFNDKKRLINYQRYDVDVDQTSFLYEFIIGMQEVKLYQGVENRLGIWESKQQKEYAINLRSFRLNSIESMGFKALSILNLCCFTGIGAIMVTHEELSMGQFFSIAFIVGQLSVPIEFLSTFFNAYINAQISGKRINSIFAKETETTASESNQLQKITPSLRASTADHYISLRNISFSYDTLTMPPVLKNFDLDIKIGEVTAIVGESGSGKSTIAKILLRLLETDHGEMFYGGQELSKVAPDHWRKICGAVFQDGMIFSDSIANNICLDKGNMNFERINWACEIAEIHTFINGLPNGYHTNLSQSGINLSKGQYQRLLIARAVYRSPEILIFDEATSALDAKTEFRVMENLWSHFENKTVVIIAHRLSTIMNADTIIFMREGQVAEIGTHEVLMQKKGGYYDLFNYQVSVIAC
ncbi:ATP-binding cassette domain-containing protein [Pedobacter petrophilus]|uniref:ATP-binding cassette domain-containing protein n=2 Tax=Pedobacter petrophilus TaxID=1908241 RepID=A0A7K0FU66_9SPHI|nr:ATP-binding cassette domain-containing protein [Pedobacter petrophilus]